MFTDSKCKHECTWKVRMCSSSMPSTLHIWTSEKTRTILTCCRAAASFKSSSASEKFENHWLKGWSLVSPRFFSYGTISIGPRWSRSHTVLLCHFLFWNTRRAGCKLRNIYIPGGGKVIPGGSLGTLAAGWFCTRRKKASVGSGKTISSYVSTTTGFLVDWGPASSSGYSLSWWNLHRLQRLTILLPQRKANIFFLKKQDQQDLQIQALVTDIAVEIKGYGYLKLSPPRLGQLERRLLHDSRRVLETRVKLKHRALDYDTQILIVCRADIYSPLVRVIPTYRGPGRGGGGEKLPLSFKKQ
jgi:hypothetical protein